MAAIYVNLEGGDVFKREAGGASGILRIPSLDDIIGTTGLAVYSDATLQLGETIQYFLTFDDVIKYIHFGKGLGNITINGFLFSDCSGSLPGVEKYLNAFQSLRGTTQDLTLGYKTFTCIVTNCNLTLMAEPDFMASFQMGFSVVDYES
jgi:hypothetical protein